MRMGAGRRRKTRMRGEYESENERKKEEIVGGGV